MVAGIFIKRALGCCLTTEALESEPLSYRFAAGSWNLLSRPAQASYFARWPYGYPSTAKGFIQLRFVCSVEARHETIVSQATSDAISQELDNSPCVGTHCSHHSSFIRRLQMATTALRGRALQASVAIRANGGRYHQDVRNTAVKPITSRIASLHPGITPSSRDSRFADTFGVSPNKTTIGAL